ncbi:hypothetical protein [Litchfieldia alkalitelluris]|uniref:hypothetical protein n=1 Tax=Litchfieldia alkalitelluris TaxID=304268 RepID=UPI000998AA27|nr:hypothetical protein [Litchfieldia alkalitelluris]
MFQKTEVMSVSEFMNRGEVDIKTKIERHFKKYGIVYKIVGTTIFIFAAGGGFDYAFAEAVVPVSGGIDLEAKKLYGELVGIGKWVIIFKGGIDTIKSMTNGEVDSAKKQFFSYLIIYLLLLGLPYGMDKVDKIFQNLN